jgi:hypothetical protein
MLSGRVGRGLGNLEGWVECVRQKAYPMSRGGSEFNGLQARLGSREAEAALRKEARGRPGRCYEKSQSILWMSSYTLD